MSTRTEGGRDRSQGRAGEPEDRTSADGRTGRVGRLAGGLALTAALALGQAGLLPAAAAPA
ncbi:hypothetical protein, partial [Microlunatus capsulatus]